MPEIINKISLIKMKIPQLFNKKKQKNNYTKKNYKIK
jgi:hypothetical protein